MARHRVLLVREWDTQSGGSGCCGRITSSGLELLHESCDDPFERNRVDMDRMGAVYRALRERFSEDEVELIVVDPRNTVWLLPAVWRDARRRGLSPREALRHLNAATTACAVVCDGKVLTTDATPQEAVEAVETDLGAQPAR